MPDFLTNIATRILGAAPLVRPSVTALFAPPRSSGGDTFGEATLHTGVSVEVGENPSAGGTAYDASRSVGKHQVGDRDDLQPDFPADSLSPLPASNVHRAQPSLLPPLPATQGRSFRVWGWRMICEPCRKRLPPHRQILFRPEPILLPFTLCPAQQCPPEKPAANNRQQNQPGKACAEGGRNGW